MFSEDAIKRTHDAVGGLLDDGEFAMSWVLVADVAGPDGTRYLAHRAGGGADGTDAPMSWTVLGMLQSSVRLAEIQVVDSSVTSGEDEDGDHA